MVVIIIIIGLVMYLKSAVVFSFLFTSNIVLAEPNALVKQAAEHGIEKCEALLQAVGSFVFEDSLHSTHANYNVGQPDSRLYATFNTRAYDFGDSHISVVVAPTSLGKCDATYVETLAFAKTCEKLREESFSDWKYAGNMQKNTISLRNDNGLSYVYLSPQEGGICLVSKREVVYE
ncbi:hypothetical protein ACKOZB_004514 [Vibrio parahaemolyticus]|uniref:hypothetical protein n=1 Tax=Vibrio vulnificus TaxID=672 RepID=UPI000D455BC2|nr:hypothetical protein [Vibrio vulnificus]EGQ7683844.1 hypothetical protein [Vibrio parahaemolyticus]EIT7146393.1 hypothetical protein [Vibrio vulnificus]EIU6784939.1 hypothetical protein [Vibrio parahaemolyticus]EIZ1364092.1 hypothetical protein [Vibrio vulnificus]EJG0181764.1 hypothetical protein [Vibrio parahaemolyticus]